MMAASSSPQNASQVDFGIINIMECCQADNETKTLRVRQTDNGLSVVKLIMDLQ